MNALITEAAGWTFLHFLWQGLAIGAIYGIFLGAFRTRPQTRYLVGCFALLLMVGAVGKTYHSQYSSLAKEAQAKASPTPVTYKHTAIAFSQCQSCHTVVDGASGEIPDSEIAPLMPIEEDYSPSLLLSWGIGIWLVGVTLLSLRLAISHFIIQRLRRNHSELPDPTIISSLKKISDQIGVRSPVQIFTSNAIAIPTVIGWVRPVILLPVASIIGLSRVQLDAILAHELAHVQRRDYLVNLLQHVLEIIFFFHPAVWFTSSAIRKEREFCCDDIAATTSQSTVDYARALATLETLRSDRPVLGMAANGGTLLTRIKRLGGDDKPRSKSLLLSSTLILIAAISIPLTVLPTHADIIDNEQASEQLVVLPLPSSEAEKGLRHLLTKTYSEPIPYEEFTKLTKSLSDVTLLSMIQEVKSMEDQGYTLWALKALLTEQSSRTTSNQLTFQSANQLILTKCGLGTTALIDSGDLN